MHDKLLADILVSLPEAVTLKTKWLRSDGQAEFPGDWQGVKLKSADLKSLAAAYLTAVSERDAMRDVIKLSKQAFQIMQSYTDGSATPTAFQMTANEALRHIADWEHKDKAIASASGVEGE